MPHAYAFWPQPLQEVEVLGIVIVGKPLKLREQSFRPYVNYIRNQLVPSGVETIYLLSRSQNRAYVNGIQESLEPEFERVRTVTFKGRGICDENDLRQA